MLCVELAFDGSLAVFRDPVTIVYSLDVPRLAAFYSDGFGFAPDFRWPPEPDSPAEFVVLKLGAHALGIGRANAPALHGRPTSATGPAATFELCLEADDVDLAVERLLELGATLLVAPADQPWSERMAYVADPEGRPIHLFTKLAAPRNATSRE